MTVEEAKEWVFCIAYFLQDNPCQEKEIDIKLPPPPVETKIIVPDVPDAPVSIEDWSPPETNVESPSETEVERQVFRLYRGFLTMF